MALFDSIISGAAEKFGLGDKAGTLLSALLALMTNQKTGGFSGFLDLFKSNGLGDTATSWITGGDNADISGDQLQSALGAETISGIADQVGIPTEKANSALGFMIPQVVDKLTPDGEIPDDEGILSKIGDLLSGWGGTAAGAVAGAAGVAGAAASGAADEAGDAVEAAGDVAGAAKEKAGDAVEAVSDAAGAAVDKGKEVVGEAAGAVTGAAGAAADKVGDAFDGVGDTFDGDGDGSILKWLLPLLLLGLLILLGFWFWGGDQGASPAGNTNTTTNENANAANAESNVNSTNAESNANAESNTNSAESNTNADAAGGGDRELSEVSLGDTKLQAYPGGIEDQLIKFIGSDEYKNATDEDLKNKWFDFDDLNFVFGKTELEAASKRQLDNIVAILKANPDVKIKIGGYTDKTGDDAANKKLSDSRAKAVKDALDKAGVGAQVPEAEGYGEEFAKVAEDASDKERASDRKTAIRLLK